MPCAAPAAAPGVTFSFEIGEAPGAGCDGVEPGVWPRSDHPRLAWLARTSEPEHAQRADQIARYDAVSLDELGYVPFDKAGADLLFGFISQRYRKTEVGTKQANTLNDLQYVHFFRGLPTFENRGRPKNRAIH